MLFAVGGAITLWAARHYAERVYDRWLYDSAQNLAQQVRLTGGRAALNLPRGRAGDVRVGREDRILFRVEGSTSGHIAGRDVPLAGRNEERCTTCRYFDAEVDGTPMRWVVLDARRCRRSARR